jgi:hypothetical protein
MNSKTETSSGTSPDLERNAETPEFIERGRINQKKHVSELKPHYDLTACRSGSSGSVAARRLAENTDASVLLLQAGGTDDMPAVTEANKWPFNLGSDPNLAVPGLQPCQLEAPATSPEIMTRFNPPRDSWRLFARVVRTKSRGRIRLTGPNPHDLLRIEANTLSHPTISKR